MLNVNQQFGHLGGKRRGVIQSNLRAAGYALMPLTPLPASAAVRRDVAPVSSSPPSMVTISEIEPHIAPGYTGMDVHDHPNGTVSIKTYKRGVPLETYEGPRWLVTDLKLQTMNDNLYREPPAEVPQLRLVTD